MPLLQWHLYDSPIVGSTWRKDLSALRPNAASFNMQADGGFADGSLSFPDVSEGLIDDALNNWLMRRVVAVDAAGYVAYEGFVAEIEAQKGYYTFHRSIDSLTNKLKVHYTKSYLGTVNGASVWVSDSASQAQYGIKEAYEDISDYGVMTLAQATAWGNTYLNAHKISQDNYFDLGANVAQHTLELTLWGYFSTLQWREAAYKWTTATEMKSIIQTVITKSSLAQFIATSNLTHLTTTGTTLTYNAGGNFKPLQDFISEVTKFGDSSNRRVLFQILEDRVPWLFARATTARVYARSHTEKLWSQAHAPLAPYKVRPGGYAVAEDFAGALDSFSDVIGDPRSTFIESTSYDAVKDTVSINPPDDTQLELLLGRMIRGRRKVKA